MNYVACKELARNGIGIEQDPKYYRIAQKRVEAAALPLFTER
jgi:DNA modification methylase